jgi:hypothetical protein
MRVAEDHGGAQAGAARHDEAVAIDTADGGGFVEQGFEPAAWSGDFTQHDVWHRRRRGEAVFST